jgi:hypothetical protein
MQLNEPISPFVMPALSKEICNQEQLVLYTPKVV